MKAELAEQEQQEVQRTEMDAKQEREITRTSAETKDEVPSSCVRYLVTISAPPVTVTVAATDPNVPCLPCFVQLNRRPLARLFAHTWRAALAIIHGCFFHLHTEWEAATPHRRDAAGGAGIVGKGEVAAA